MDYGSDWKVHEVPARPGDPKHDITFILPDKLKATGSIFVTRTVWGPGTSLKQLTDQMASLEKTETIIGGSPAIRIL